MVSRAKICTENGGGERKQLCDIGHLFSPRLKNTRAGHTLNFISLSLSSPFKVSSCLCQDPMYLPHSTLCPYGSSGTRAHKQMRFSLPTELNPQPPQTDTHQTRRHSCLPVGNQLQGNCYTRILEYLQSYIRI